MKFLFVLCSIFALSKGSTVCYEQLGCFSSGKPFLSFPTRPISVTPKSPDDIKTTFLLYVKPYQNVPQELDARKLTNIARTWTTFQARPTKIIIHGFTDNPKTDYWMEDMAHAFIRAEPCNVIVVDWHNGNQLPYTQATANTRVVGAQVALLIRELVNQFNMATKDFHIVGHSLGAHTAGYAGERVPGLGRITGLDPASPYFSGTDKVVRLDPTDALFVDVIHTDAEYISLGTPEPAGHVDFYPNGGHDQPGCPKDPVTSFFHHFITGIADVVVCNHRRAFEYFSESIKSQCPFQASPCASEDDFRDGKCNGCHYGQCVSMGYKAIKPTGVNDNNTQKYYLYTSSKAPFCQNY